MTREPDDPFTQTLRGMGYRGTVGLVVHDFTGHLLYSTQAERPFPAASTIKVPLLIQALQLAQAGELDLAERVTLKASDRVTGAGVLHELQSGLALTWQDILTLMVIVSDNTATNLIIERLGVEKVNRWLKQHQMGTTRLVGKLQLPAEQQNEAQRRGERNQTSAQDQAALLLGLVNGEWLDPKHADLALDILKRQQLCDLIGRGMLSNRNGEPLYPLASKSGELLGIHHDVGLLYTPRPLVIALLSEGGSDAREHPENRDVSLLSTQLWPLLAHHGHVYSRAGLGDI